MIKDIFQNKKKDRKGRARSNEMVLAFSENEGKKRKKKAKKEEKGHRLRHSLVPLSGKTIVKAPKIFKNQIFCDVYDEIGNHDRIIEFSTDTDQDFNSGQAYITPSLLELPSVGRNMYSTKKIVFY